MINFNREIEEHRKLCEQGRYELASAKVAVITYNLTMTLWANRNIMTAPTDAEIITTKSSGEPNKDSSE